MLYFKVKEKAPVEKVIIHKCLDGKKIVIVFSLEYKKKPTTHIGSVI